MKIEPTRYGRPSERDVRSLGLGSILLLVLCAALVAGGTGAAATWWLTTGPANRTAETIARPVDVDSVPLSRLTLAPLITRAAPGVVNIAVLQPSPLEQNPLLRDPYFRDFIIVPEEALAPRISAGSGFIVDAARGLVITNRHVVENARAIEVAVGERRFEARLVALARGIDLAVLEIPARDLTALPLGDSDKVSVGDYVVAIGNPFEIGQTVTAGIVSAIGRSRRGGAAYVQTDAPINPGNSGGPLISMRGEVIGINTAIIGPGEGNVGIGLAIPSNVAKQLVDQLRPSR